jgi:hypothetical protein
VSDAVSPRDPQEPVPAIRTPDEPVPRIPVEPIPERPAPTPPGPSGDRSSVTL